MQTDLDCILKRLWKTQHRDARHMVFERGTYSHQRMLRGLAPAMTQRHVSAFATYRLHHTHNPFLSILEIHNSLCRNEQVVIVHMTLVVHLILVLCCVAVAYCQPACQRFELLVDGHRLDARFLRCLLEHVNPCSGCRSHLLVEVVESQPDAIM